MGYANILVAVSGAEDDRRALRAAANLANTSGGVVRILVVLPAEAASVWAAAFGGAYMASETIKALDQANYNIRMRVIAAAKEVAADMGLSYGLIDDGARIQMMEAADTSWLCLMREAPMADVIVISAATARAEGVWSSVLADALLTTLTPVLIVRSERPIRGGIAAIAWDGSFPAGRAVRAAMPLLGAASSVVILQDPEGLDPAERDAGCPFKLKDELLRRGLKAVTIAQVPGNDEGARLVDAAMSVGADLLVSGGYGHSRIGEALFGGATRSFLKADANIHYFMAH